MLYYNLNYLLSNQIDEERYIPAIILNPTGYERSAAFKRMMKVLRGRLNIQRVILDPQLYFLDLQRFRSGAVPKDQVIKCVSSYEWLGVGRGDLESGELRQEVVGGEAPSLEEIWANRKTVTGDRWETTVRSAIGYQLELGCDALILPSALYSNHASNLEDEMGRLYEAIRIAQTLNGLKLPIYASLPLADSLFEHGSSAADHFIDTLVDNVSAMPGLMGVYVPFIQDKAATDRISNEEVARGLLRMAKMISTCTNLKAIFNFVECLGLLCRALGAEGYGTGPSLRQRQFTADEFLEQMAKATPKFYSLHLCAEFRPEHEMEWIRDGGLLPRIESDRTEASEDLYKALEAGLSVGGNVPRWEAASKNLAATRAHYFAQQVKAIERIDKPEIALGWISDAASEYEQVQASCIKQSRDHGFSLNPTHHKPWRNAFQEVMNMQFR